MAKQAITLAEEGKAPRGYVEIRHIGQIVANMLSQALDCFVRQDVELALKVAQEDACCENAFSVSRLSCSSRC